MDAVIGEGVKLVTNSLNYRENVESLGKKIEELTCRVEDIEERARKEESFGKKKRKREVENWLNDVKNAKDNFIALQNKVNEEGRLKNPMSGEHVVKLLEQVAKLDAQSKTHHFRELVLDANDNKGELRLTTELSGETFKENLERIKQHLFNDNITSIGICGMGGVGKTTLAKHINNDLLKIPDFHVCWLTVSQGLSIKKLQEGIARYMNISLSNDDDEEQRAWKLSQKLKGIKKFVLILDDVWKFFCLKKLGVSLDAEHRLIFTTRSLGLCHQMLCQEIIQVKTLQPHEAWDLFKATLGYQNRFDEDMEAVARKILKNCGGLPLGIITMAGSMRGVVDLQEWRNALNQLKSSSKGLDDMERDVFPVLQWSFSRLNKYQQCCLLCCSLYPEDCIIDREEIISRFISLDLMVRMDTKKKEYDQGHAILNHLIKSCLLEKAIHDFHEVEGIKMHDLIRYMALRLTSGNSNYSDMRMPRYMVKSGVGLKIVPEEEEWTKDLDVVSLMDNDISEISNDTSPQCGNLSTLILKGNCLKSISDSFFAQFKTQLKVLDLSWNGIKELPNCTSEMVNLTTLILEGCSELKSLPPLGKLKKLRELNLRQTSIDNIPEGLEELVNLKYLNMMIAKIPQIPEGTFSRLRHLQELRIYTAIEMKELEGLKQLEIFDGCISNIDSLNKFIKSHHDHLWYDRYHIGVGNYAKYFSLTNHKFNKELALAKCNFGNTEGKGGVYQLVLLPQDIERLIVYECIGTGACLEDTIQLNTTGLNSLFIYGLPEVEFLLRLPSCSSPLQVLQKLRIEDMQNLTGIVRWEDSSATFGKILHLHHHGTFSCLRHFSITSCNKITKLFPNWLLQNLQNLEKLFVFRCEELQEIITVEGEDSSSSGTTIPPTLPKLKFLNLQTLPRLRSICDGTLFWDSMERILIFDCPNLKRPPHFPTATIAKNVVVHSAFNLK